MTFSLRPYQAEALSEIQSVYRSGIRRALLVAPTGAGKSAMVRHMLESTGMSTLILVHRQELLDMVSESLPVRHGIIQAGRALPADKIAVGMMQTVSRRLDVLPRYQWIISDEAHLAMCPTWELILNHYGDSWHLGMSATPCRLDGIGLGKQYGRIVQGPSISELTARGFLAPARCFAPPIKGAAKVAEQGSKSSDRLEQQAEALDNAYVTGDSIDHYRRLAAGKQAIVFCANRKHGANVAAQFTMAGYPAVFVDGEMSKAERSQKIADFRARKYLLLVNVELLTTGFDCPQIECAIFLRRTESLALYLQMIGRALRIFFGKAEAVILDHVGNIARHGLPASTRIWTLDGAPVRAQAAAVRQCPSCYLCHDPAPRCPSCGHSYIAVTAAKPRKKILSAAGELVEVRALEIEAAKALPLKDALRTVKSRDDLVRIAKERGYHHRWVDRQMQFRPKLAQTASG